MRKILAWALAAGLAFPGLAFSGTVPLTQALSFTGGESFASVGQPLPNTVGWTFNLASDITLVQLGFFDMDGNGLLANHEVAIWRDDDQSLVATATVLKLDTLSGGFRWADVATPVLMTAGDYRIGALVREDDYFYSKVTTIATASPVTFTGSAYALGSSAAAAFASKSPGAAAYSLGDLSFPDQVQADGRGRFGPNFQFVTAVPEPSTVLLMLGGLVAVAGVARRRRRMG